MVSLIPGLTQVLTIRHIVECIGMEATVELMNEIRNWPTPDGQHP